jgi:hypothetical protein
VWLNGVLVGPTTCPSTFTSPATGAPLLMSVAETVNCAAWFVGTGCGLMVAVSMLSGAPVGSTSSAPSGTDLTSAQV